MIELVELHFENAHLPTLVRWHMRWDPEGATPDEITAHAPSQGGPGPHFHWNLAFMALCQALVRLRSRAGGHEPLLRGRRGSAADIVSRFFIQPESLMPLRTVLARPSAQQPQDMLDRLGRWFRPAREGTHALRPVAIHAGKRPPARVRVWLDGRELDDESVSQLEGKIEWMAGEHDWLGSVAPRIARAMAA